MNIKAVIGSGAAVLAAAGGALATADDYWPRIGWTTPSQHDADFAVTGEQLKDFRDEWKCDEYEEELIALLERQDAGDSAAETQHRIDRIRNKMEKIKCERFEDFG